MLHAPPGTDRNSAKRMSTALLAPVFALMTICAKRANLVKKKLKAAHHMSSHNRSVLRSRKIQSPRLPSAKPKTISNRATMCLTQRRHGNNHDEADTYEELDFGQGGVWQRTILMGNKCQPLDFSGVIYYDENGQQVNELPIRSPLASPSPGYLMKTNSYISRNFNINSTHMNHDLVV